MKIILVFDMNGDLFKQIQYKTKKQALLNLRFFKKNGMISETGIKINGLTFELV